MAEAKFRTPTLQKLIWIAFQIYHYVRPGSRCAKFCFNRFKRYESCMRQKMRFRVEFFK